MEPDQPPLEFEIKKQLLGEDIRANNFQMKPRAVSFIFFPTEYGGFIILCHF